MTIEEAIERIQHMEDAIKQWKWEDYNSRTEGLLNVKALEIAIKTMKEQTERPDYRKP